MPQLEFRPLENYSLSLQLAARALFGQAEPAPEDRRDSDAVKPDRDES